MKKHDLKRLGLEAEEYQKDVNWLKKRLENEVDARKIGRLKSEIRAREKRLQGILDKAKAYGKGISVFIVDLEIIDGTTSKHVQIPYVDIDESEIDLLLARDLKGLNYKKLTIIKGITGEIYQ